MNKYLGWAVTFIFVTITFTIFRGNDLVHSFNVIQSMFTLTSTGFSLQGVDDLLFFIFVCL